MMKTLSIFGKKLHSCFVMSYGIDREHRLYNVGNFCVKVERVDVGYEVSVGRKVVTKWFTIPSCKVLLAALVNVIDVITYRKVYYYRSGMDCDGVQFGGPVVYSNIRIARERMESDYQWSDGPLSFSRMTRLEYREAESFTRDRGMEAFEDGHSHCWRV